MFFKYKTNIEKLILTSKFGFIRSKCYIWLMKKEDIEKLLDTIGFDEIELTDGDLTEYRKIIYNNHEYRLLNYSFNSDLNKCFTILKKYKLIDNRQKDNDFKGDRMFIYPSAEYEKISNEIKEVFKQILRKKKIDSLL